MNTFKEPAARPGRPGDRLGRAGVAAAAMTETPAPTGGPTPGRGDRTRVLLRGAPGAELRAAALPALAREATLAGRPRAVMHAGVAVSRPYHGFAASFFKTAEDPGSPLSPLSAESPRPARPGVHDRSPDQRRTRALIDAAVPLRDRAIQLSRPRVLRPVTREDLMRLLRDPGDTAG